MTVILDRHHAAVHEAGDDVIRSEAIRRLVEMGLAKGKAR